ncbi:MAG: hypothetical protein ACOVQC_09165 [Flavobacterium sp.]
MKKLIYLIVCLIVTLQSCNGQTTAKKEIYNKDFNWKITIPENFENVSAEDWTKMQNKGADAIEKTFEGEIINQSKTIFVFKSDQLNYFESNYQPFDVSIDGDYLESCKNVNEVLIETFKAQMPNAKIDTITTVEKIDNLEFQVFKMKIEYPNKMILNLLMYSRLFGKKEFTVNIMYVDNKKGQLMTEAWKNSKFLKQ